MSKRNKSKSKRVLKQLKRIRGLEREEHFGSGKPLGTWIRPLKAQADTREKRKRTRGSKKTAAIRDFKEDLCLESFGLF